MSMTKIAGLTPARQKILDAIDAGHIELEAICQATGTVSRSTIAQHLKRLAEEGHIILEERGGRVFVDRGLQGYAAGWDAACRAMGNDQA